MNNTQTVSRCTPVLPMLNNHGDDIRSGDDAYIGNAEHVKLRKVGHYKITYFENSNFKTGVFKTDIISLGLMK